MTSWDWRSARGTFALGVLLFAIACVISGATDEGSVTWGIRFSRALPLVPLCGAVVTFLVLRRAERRGEMLALESIGCSPSRIALMIVASACALSVVAAITVASLRGATVDAFFPRPSAHAEPRVDSNAFVDDVKGIRIHQDGTMTRTETRATSEVKAQSGRAFSAAALLVLLGLALPLVAARAAKHLHTREITAALSMCVLCTFFMQSAAAGRAPAVLALFPASVLLIFAIVRYRLPSW